MCHVEAKIQNILPPGLSSNVEALHSLVGQVSEKVTAMSGQLTDIGRVQHRLNTEVSILKATNVEVLKVRYLTKNKTLTLPHNAHNFLRLPRL